MSFWLIVVIKTLTQSSENILFYITLVLFYINYKIHIHMLTKNYLHNFLTLIIYICINVFIFILYYLY